MQDQYITRHLPDGRIIYADHRIATIAGYLPGEVIETKVKRMTMQNTYMMFIHSRLPSWKGVYLLMTITRALNDNEESSDDDRIQPSPGGDYDDNGNEWPPTRAWLQNFKIASVHQNL